MSRRYGVAVTVYGNGATRLIGVTEGNDTRNVLNCERAVVGNILVKDYLLRLCGVLGKHGGGGCPIAEDYVKLARDLIVVNVIDSGFLGGDGCGIVLGKRFYLGSVDLTVCTLCVLGGNVALGVHKAEDLVGELGMRLIRLVGVGLLRGNVVVAKLLLEELERVIVVGKKVLVGNGAYVVGNSTLVAGAYGVSKDSSLHILVADLLGGGSLHLGVEEVDKLVHSRLSACACLRCDHAVAVVSARAYGLSSVLGKTEDLGGVKRGRARVNGVKVNVEVEKHVLHSQGVSVGKEDAVLKHEGVGDGLVRVFDYVVVLNDDCLTVAVGDLDLFVNELGGEHTDLRHADDGGVGSGG